MALPTLRLVSVSTFTANAWTAVVPLVSANRALVVSKIVVVNGQNAATTFGLLIGTTSGSGTGHLAYATPLAGGQTYSETGLVIPAGYGLFAVTSTANGIVVTVSGEEVDN